MKLEMGFYIMKSKILIIDNDTSNQASVFNAIKSLGYSMKISRTKNYSFILILPCI